MRIEFFFVVFLFVGLVSGSSVTCTIVEDSSPGIIHDEGKVLVEIELDDGDSVIFPQEYSSLEENGNKVSFISREFSRRDGDCIFALPVVVDSPYDLRVYLPQNHVLSDGLIYPKDYEISSDGKNIILDWSDVEEEVIVFYDGVYYSYLWVLIVGAIALVFVILFFRFQGIRFNKELERLKAQAAKNVVNKESLIVRNLIGEEKRIVEFLVGKKSSWMKDIVRELGISKVMATRKIRSLVEKGIVKKENFGKENKISLVKK